MATTDARSGFRLPWSTDRPNDGTEEPTGDNAPAETAWSTDESATAESGMDAATATAETETAPDAIADVAPPAAADVPAEAPKSPKKPNKFLADLTKAMQAAAEEARGIALSQLQADAKTHVESIHGRSATESADLRRTADDDVAAIREWSKAEIARIREETDQKITDRKGRLETEIEGHAAVIEREIEAVQGTVAAVRRRDGRVLRAPPRRGGPDAVRDDGREPARAADVRGPLGDDRRAGRAPGRRGRRDRRRARRHGRGRDRRASRRPLKPRRPRRARLRRPTRRPASSPSR